MTRTKTLLALAVGALCFSAQAVELRSADVHNSDDYPTVAAVKHMSQELAKQSNGKFTIKVFNKGALGSEKETLDQVKIGALDMNRINISALNSLCPKSLVPTMPFLFDSIPHMRKVLDGPIGEEILKGCEAQGLVGLAFYDSGARSIYAKKPVKTLADAKGLKIRVQAQPDKHRTERQRDERQRNEWQKKDQERLERHRHEEPRRNWGPNERNDWERRQREEWQREENRRHAWEMRRRAWESDHEWHERQHLEKERHEHRMRQIQAEIAAAVIRIFVN